MIGSIQTMASQRGPSAGTVFRMAASTQRRHHDNVNVAMVPAASCHPRRVAEQRFTGRGAAGDVGSGPAREVAAWAHVVATATTRRNTPSERPQRHR